MRKVAFISFVVVVLLVGAGILAYLFGYTDVFLSKPPPKDQGASVPPKPALIGLSVLTSRSVVSPTLSLDQRSVWYFDEAGQLYRNNVDGGSEQNFPLPNVRPVKTVLWQPKGNDFIQRLAGTGGNDVFRLYQAQSKIFVDFPANFQSVAWLPDGKRIVYVWRSGDGSNSLKTSNADGSNFATVVALPASYEIESSPNANVVMLYQPASAAGVAKALRVDVDAKTTTELLDRGKNLEVKFSPDGSKLLFNRVHETTGKPELWLHDLQTKSFLNLKIATAIVKTAWHSSSGKFYYALPETIASGDVRAQQKTKDTLYAYTIGTVASAKLPGQESAPQLDVRDPVIADSDAALFFRNGWDSKLYQFKQSGGSAGAVQGTTEGEPYD